MAVTNVATTKTHTSVSSLSSRAPGSTPLWQVGLQLRSSHESKRNTCSTITEEEGLEHHIVEFATIT